MKIVFFETQEWEREILQSQFPDCVMTSDKLNEETVSSYQDAQIVSCFISSRINSSVIDQLPQLVYIATRSTGYDHIDIAHAKTKNIAVSNVPEYGSDTVAEHTFGLILSLTRKIYQSVNQSKTLNFAHDQIRGVDLAHKTIGIIGVGKIGHRVARIAHGFKMNILATSRSQRQDLIDKYQIQYVSLEELLAQSDIISLNLALTPQTKHTINIDNIHLCKKGSYLINTARGGLVETAAVMKGLEQNIFAGVGLDVLEEENELGEEAAILTKDYQNKVDLKTLVMNHLLINHPRVLITPHNAFNSREALMRIVQTTIGNIQSFVSGAPVNTLAV